MAVIVPAIIVQLIHEEAPKVNAPDRGDNNFPQVTQAQSDSDVPGSFSPAYRRSMSTKHIRTVADLVRFGAGLRIDCVECGASKTLDGFEAAKVGGGAGTLAALRSRLKCSRCGEKAARMAILPPV